MQIPKKISIELAEETGWHIGDGSMNFYNQRGKQKGIYQLRGHIEDDKKHYEKRIKPLFKKLYGINIKLREMPKTRVFGFQIWNDELVNFKKKLGLCLGKKFNVEIPKIFLSKENLKRAVLRGIFDTDGGIYLEKKNKKLYPRLTITTISPKLSNQLLENLRGIKIRTSKYAQFYPRGMNRKELYILVIRGVEMFHKFMKEINPQNPKHQAKYKLFIESQNL